MKKNLFTALLLLSSHFLLAQKGIPETAVSNLKQKFPTATKVHWDKEKNGDFEAEFKLNGTSISVTFSPTGDWLETETGMSASGLPAAVLTAFRKEHGAAKIKAADKIESAKPICYEIEYKDGVKTKEIVYDEQGKIMNDEL
jgi:Putative beta-lactamase-inhibitor-like, PepSY-like